MEKGKREMRRKMEEVVRSCELREMQRKIGGGGAVNGVAGGGGDSSG